MPVAVWGNPIPAVWGNPIESKLIIRRLKAMRKILLVVFLVLAAFVFGCYERDAAAEVTITAVKVSGDIPLDPAHTAWKPVPISYVDLNCQVLAEPKNMNCATRVVEVSALTNGKEIAVRLRWSDQSKDELNLHHEQYRDAAALEFAVKPVNPGEEPAYTMGNGGDMVNIWHWKAEWQKDGDRRQDMEDTYPNMSADWYVDEQPDGKISYHDRQGKNLGSFDPAAYSHNIFAQVDLRHSPVEDLNAEGFGTLTTQKSQDVSGYGTWDKNGWSVVFKRTLTTKDENDVQFTGAKFPVAFAVWDGSNAERDGLKSISQWNYIEIK